MDYLQSLSVFVCQTALRSLKTIQLILIYYFIPVKEHTAYKGTLVTKRYFLKGKTNGRLQ